jgi:hypothetical protein
MEAGPIVRAAITDVPKYRASSLFLFLDVACWIGERKSEPHHAALQERNKNYPTRSSLDDSQTNMSNSTAAAQNYDPNANNAYLVYIPSAVFVVICPILMGLRIWVRLRKGGKLGSDDWTAIVALVSRLSINTATCGLLTAGRSLPS